MAGKGSLTLTGQLGDVMKESAQAALSFARAHALALGLRDEFYAGREIHIHVPSGGVPKDGPSAGVTMACALVSLISRTPVRHDLAMTGELTLRGKVLPIGGLKEKLLAAVRAGMTQVMIPAATPPSCRKSRNTCVQRLTITPVRTMSEVLEAALVLAGKGRAAGKDPTQAAGAQRRRQRRQAARHARERQDAVGRFAARAQLSAPAHERARAIAIPHATVSRLCPHPDPLPADWAREKGKRRLRG